MKKVYTKIEPSMNLDHFFINYENEEMLTFWVRQLQAHA